MKYLHINQWDTRGGSARVSLRLHLEMLRRGVDSHLMVAGRTGIPREPVPCSSLLAEEWWLQRMDDAIRSLSKMSGTEDRFYASSWMLPVRKRFQDADVVQIYGISGGYFAYPVLPLLSRKKPLIWWLTDPWLFTGKCTYPGACEAWKTGCGNCGLCGSAAERRVTERNWQFKRRVYERTKGCLVAPSKWLYGLAKSSPLMQAFRIEYVPNGVDTDVFRPLDRGVMRRLWGVPEKARIVLMSTSTFSDPRKGALLIGPILERVRALSEGMEIHVLFAGRRHPPLEAALAKYLPFTPTGFIEEARLMATLYNAADLLLHPSLDENLSNMTCDCMACGTPVFCFDVGGMRDIVSDGRTGMAAKAGDCEALACAIVAHLKGEFLPEDVRDICANVIRSGFTVKDEAGRILELAGALVEERGTMAREVGGR